MLFRAQFRSRAVRGIGLLARLDLWPAIRARERILRKVSFSFLQLDKEEEYWVLFTQTRFELATMVF